MAKARKRQADVMPVIESIRSAGIATLKGIAAELNSRSIPAPRGGQSTATQVSRILSTVAQSEDSIFGERHGRVFLNAFK